MAKAAAQKKRTKKTARQQPYREPPLVSRLSKSLESVPLGSEAEEWGSLIEMESEVDMTAQLTRWFASLSRNSKHLVVERLGLLQREL